MAQPSVASYFNTRKRVAIDDVKINNAKRVLIDDNSEKVTSIESSKEETKDVKSDKNTFETNEIHKLVPNKIVVSTEAPVPMAKKAVKRTTKRRVVVGPKGQQNLQNFVTKIPTDETEKSLVKGDASKDKHCTPPASPVKPQNAMDKVTEKNQDSSLNALKIKLSRSSRLAELKASISRFNESHKKLEEIEKVTSKIASPKESPKLQSFKSIELEVHLSPQKVQSPEKRYLSPRKDVTARKNLLNLLSPTKNTVSICESPSKKIYEETSKPALTLPYKYRFIAEMFRSIDTVCQLMFNRKETITFSKLQPAVEKMTKRNLTSRCVAQIKHIYPEAFKFHQEKLRVYGTGRREERWELVISPSVGGNDHMTSDILLTRKRIFFELLLNKVKDYHEEFLLSLEPPMVIPKDKITRWHVEFDIERLPDIEEDELPEPPEEHKLTTGQEVLAKAREMFKCNTRMEEALERLKAAKEQGTVEKVEEKSKNLPSSILKGIPKGLLEKVRQKQAAKALLSMTRSSDKERELQIYSRLPELARLTRNLFVSEKKSVLPLDGVVAKLGNCYRITLTTTEMEDHIKLLAKELPDWMVLHNIRNTMFVKLDKKADLSVIINKLENLTKVKSDT